MLVFCSWSQQCLSTTHSRTTPDPGLVGLQKDRDRGSRHDRREQPEPTIFVQARARGPKQGSSRCQGCSEVFLRHLLSFCQTAPANPQLPQHLASAPASNPHLPLLSPRFPAPRFPPPGWRLGRFRTSTSRDAPTLKNAPSLIICKSKESIDETQKNERMKERKQERHDSQNRKDTLKGHDSQNWKHSSRPSKQERTVSVDTFCRMCQQVSFLEIRVL